MYRKVESDDDEIFILQHFGLLLNVPKSSSFSALCTFSSKVWNFLLCFLEIYTAGINLKLMIGQRTIFKDIQGYGQNWLLTAQILQVFPILTLSLNTF